MKLKRKIETKSSLPILRIFVVMLLFAIMCPIVFVISAIYQFEHQRDINRDEYYLRLLPSQVSSNLCNHGVILESLVDCNESEVQITYGQMRELAEYYTTQQLSYTEISFFLAEYEASCWINHPEDGYFRCNYQLTPIFNLLLVFETQHETLVSLP